MPSRPAAGVEYVYCKVYGTSDQKEFSNEFWYSVSSGALAPPLDGAIVATTIYTTLCGPWLEVLNQLALLRGIYCELSDGSVVIGTPFYQDQQGQEMSTDYLPGDVAAVVQKITAHPGKTGRGRWYFSCVGVDLATNSYINPSGMTLFQSLSLTARTNITVTGASGPIVLAPAHFSPTDGLLYPILQAPVVALLGTKRRRRGPF